MKSLLIILLLCLCGHLGWAQNALHFDGQYDWLELSLAGSNFDNPNPDFSTSIWFQTENTSTDPSCPGNFKRLLTLASLGNYFEIGECGNNVLNLYSQLPGTGNSENGFVLGTLTTNTWYHLCVIKAGFLIEIFIDGAVVYSNTLSPNPNNKFDFLRLGHWRGGNLTPGQNWIGLMDDFQLYDIALDPVVLNDQRYCGINGDEEGLLAYWTFEDAGIVPGGDNTAITQIMDFSATGTSVGTFGTAGNSFSLNGATSNFVAGNNRNNVPDVKTFDVSHSIQEDTLVEIMDFGFAGIINQNGNYVSVGLTAEKATNDIGVATVHYDVTGTVIATPQLAILPEMIDYVFTDAEEIVTAGANDGYMMVTEQDDNGRVSFVRLNPTGVASWVDQVELNFNGTPYSVTPNDFLIDNNLAVVTGDIEYGTTTQPFVLIYDYVARSVECVRIYQLNPGVASVNQAHVIVNNNTNNHYTIAGRTDHQLYYLEVEYNCIFAQSNQAILFPLDGSTTTRPVAQEILYDPQQDNPIICGTITGGGASQLFVQNGFNATFFAASTGDDTELHDALFNQSGELILAGHVDNNTDGKGFLLSVNHSAFGPGSLPVNWSKAYASDEYPASNILDLELAIDGGYFTAGFGVRQNAAGVIDYDLTDTWVMKTDEDGVLNNCDCYEDISWNNQFSSGAGNLMVAQVDADNTVTTNNRNTIPLQYTEYFCDQYCPPIDTACQVAATATKTADPEDLCCYDLSFFIDPVHTDEYTQIQVRPLPGAALTPLTALDPQYSLISNTSSAISLISNTGNLCNGLDRFLPTGTLPSVELCVTDFNGNMPMVKVDFITCDGAVCSDTLTLECSPCIEITNDSLTCEGGDLKYVFDFQNTWDRPIKRLVVNSFAPTGAVFTPDTLFFPAGIPVGAAAGANCVLISNVSAPDSLKFDFKALGDDECCFCISNEVCLPIPLCCDTCESIEYIVTDTIINGEECCYSLDIYHCTDDLFTALRLTALGGVTMSQQSAGSGWSMYNLGQSSSMQQTWFPRPTPIHFTNIPTGWNRSKVNFCLDNDGRSLSETIQLEWLAGNDESVVCTDSLFFECQLPPPDSTCAQITDTLWSCNPDGSYDLDLKVQVKWGSPAYEIYLKNFSSTPPGAVVTSNPQVTNGVFATDSIVMLPTLNVSNVMPGDSLCFEIALADTLTDYIQECCYVEVCLVVPPINCCETCENIEYQLTDTIINGEECCYKLDFYQCTDDLFTALRLRAIGGVTISQQVSGPTWSIYNLAQSSNTEQTWFPRPTPIHDTPIPSGWTRNEVSFCLSNYDGLPLPQVVQLEWLAGNDDEVICTDSLFFECALPTPDSTCAQVVDTTWTCDSLGNYSLDMNVEVQWPQAAVQVYIKNFTSPNGVTVSPDPLIVNGNFSTNTIVNMPTLTLNNAMPGDSICFSIALADTLIAEQYSNECCYVEVCLVVPECSDTVGLGCEQWETDVRNEGFSIQQRGSTSTIEIRTPSTMTNSDWWTLNHRCNSPERFWIVSPGDGGVNLGTNGSYVVCIDAYRVVNGDTCKVSFVYEGSVRVTSLEACLSEYGFRGAVNEAVSIDHFGQQVVINAPSLNQGSKLIVDFMDGSSIQEYSTEALPISYEYEEPGDYEPRVTIEEYDDAGELCNRHTVATANPSAVAIGLNLYPNPNRGAFQLDFELPQSGGFDIAVFDINGRKVLSSQHRLTAGEQHLTLGTDKLPPGAYFLRMMGSDFVATAKFQRIQ